MHAAFAPQSLFAVGELWRIREEGDGLLSYWFTQITINADRHPLLSRMHKPGDEKRSLVVIPERDYDSWLDCQNPDLARGMLGFTNNIQLISTPAQKYTSATPSGELFNSDEPTNTAAG